MAKRKISTFDLGVDLQSTLKKSNFRTVEDVLSESFLQLMAKLHLSADETQNLLSKLSVACLPPCYQGCDLMLKGNENAVPFGDRKLDLILQGGVQRATLTEFAGPSSVGKTQMCFHLALQCMQMKWSQNGVCCIDTEGSFRPERLYEMMDAGVEDCENLLSKFHVFQAKTVSSLNEILSKLELFCIEKDVGLIMVDSIASLARKEFSQDTKFQRAAALSSWAAQFKALADQLNISVIVTNQVTSRVVKDDSSSDEDDNEAKSDVATKEVHFVIPALGTTWTHFVNTRFILQFVNAEERELIVAKSPVAPITVKSYRITKRGIEFAGSVSYTLDGMNLAQHRIKVQPAF